MSKKRKPKPKAPAKPKAPKLEGRKLKQVDLGRMREIRQTMLHLREALKVNDAAFSFLLKTYVQEGEKLKSLDLEKGVAVVALKTEGGK